MGDFHSEGKSYPYVMLELIGLRLVFPNVLGQDHIEIEDLIEIEQNFDHEVEVDDNEEIENIENLSQNSNDFLSQEADNGVHYYVCY